MKPEDAFSMVLEMADTASTVLLGTVDSSSAPQIRAMLHMEHEGLHTIWMTTNTSSRKIRQLQSDNRACLYFYQPDRFLGLQLEGAVEILQDRASKERIWKPGFEMYYPQGVDDPDYSVLCFHSKSGILYSQLSCTSFDIPTEK